MGSALYFIANNAIEHAIFSGILACYMNLRRHELNVK